MPVGGGADGFRHHVGPNESVADGQRARTWPGALRMPRSRRAGLGQLRPTAIWARDERSEQRSALVKDNLD